MKSKLFEIVLSLLIISFSANSLNQKHVSIKWPELENELNVNEYQVQLISLANTKLNVTALPKDAREDGEFIMSELRENLDVCRNQLLNDHSLWQLYKMCVHQQLDVFDNQIWDLINSLSNDISKEHDGDDDDDAGSLKLFTFSLLIVCFVVLNLL